jgi:hypothetical protein
VVTAATIPPVRVVSPRSTAYACRASLVAGTCSGGVPSRQARSVPAHASVARGGRSGGSPCPTSSTRSWWPPAGTTSCTVSAPSGPGDGRSRTRASPEPDQRQRSAPASDPVHTPSGARRASREPASASVTRSRASPSTGVIRRSSTNRSGSPGSTSASRHSTTPPPVTQRLFQISVPVS